MLLGHKWESADFCLQKSIGDVRVGLLSSALWGMMGWENVGVCGAGTDIICRRGGLNEGHPWRKKEKVEMQQARTNGHCRTSASKRPMRWRCTCFLACMPAKSNTCRKRDGRRCQCPEMIGRVLAEQETLMRDTVLSYILQVDVKL